MLQFVSANGCGAIAYPRKTPLRIFRTVNIPRQRGSSNILKASRTQLQGNSADVLPDSKEQAVRQAAEALKSRLEAGVSSVRGGKKGLAGNPNSFLGLEVPVLDNSLESEVQLAKDIIAKLPSNLRKKIQIVPLCTSPTLQGKVIMVPRPKLEDIGQLQQLSKASSLVVVLNPNWVGNDGVPQELRSFTDAVETVYCFLPVAIKASIFTVQEGAVFKADAFSPWRIYMQSKSSWNAVGRMDTRPTGEDVEVAFYNSTAAHSPLTQGVKFLKGLVRK